MGALKNDGPLQVGTMSGGGASGGNDTGVPGGGGEERDTGVPTGGGDEATEGLGGGGVVDANDRDVNPGNPLF